MSGKGRIYQGDKYKFKLGNRIGKGGNGEVYEVEILDSKCKEKYVVKVLSIYKWKGEIKKIRYNRFHKEIYKVVELQKDIPGIMEIVDFYCPSEIPVKSNVWYLMHRAQNFRKFSENNKLSLETKLEYLISLSDILCNLHNRGCSHRDIKVDNLLILNNELILTDFGLIWSADDSRITMEGERLGPFYIGPPELESRDLDMDDFRPSDVYLFSKVVWEILKEDYLGFRGEYIRSNEQFYLNPLDYDIVTFEPIHQLLEQATKTSIYERIDINKCRELLKEQLLIENKDIPDKELQYRFNELEKEIINKHEPDERIFSKYEVIYDVLKNIIPISDIIIKGANDKINADSIET